MTARPHALFAGKQVILGRLHFAEARDEAAAELIALLLNGHRRPTEDHSGLAEVDDTAMQAILDRAYTPTTLAGPLPLEEQALRRSVDDWLDTETLIASCHGEA